MISSLSAEVTGFNRYMVECKYLLLCLLSFLFPVLIDTWWNVNKSKFSLHMFSPIVLIDTWWNVNKEPYTLHLPKWF